MNTDGAGGIGYLLAAPFLLLRYLAHRQTASPPLPAAPVYTPGAPLPTTGRVEYRSAPRNFNDDEDPFVIVNGELVHRDFVDIYQSNLDDEFFSGDGQGDQHK